jgi:hypothetical protein
MEIVLVIFIFIFVLGPLVKAYTERLNRQLPPASEPTRAELAQLRDEVERLSAQVEKLTDEQSFMLRLLNPGDEAPSSPPELFPADRSLYDRPTPRTPESRDADAR